MGSVKTKRISIVLIAIAIIAAVMSLLFNLLNGRETHVSDGNNNIKIRSLYCSSNEPAEPFFKYTGEKAEHRIKYIFDDSGVIDNISYTYDATFTSNEKATQAEAQLHVDYNVYMSKNEVYQEDLTPTFIVNDNNLLINLFMSQKTFNIGTAAFVFLTQEDIEDVGEYTIENLKKVYEAKGFSCDIKE